MIQKKYLQQLLLPLAVAGMVSGIWAGWLRLQWDLPFHNISAHHGALMVGSFLGTLIILERAVTFKSRWWLLLPLINGVSIFFFFAGAAQTALLFLVAGAAGMVIMFISITIRHPYIYHFLIAGGAVWYLVGNIYLYITGSYPGTFTWWMAFFLWTIVGERLELSRYLNISKNIKFLLIIFLLIFLAGVILPFHTTGRYFLAAGVAGSALWLLRYDMARKAVKAPGQFRFTAICLITGYIWLLVNAAIAAFGFRLLYSFDAHLHAFFLGFVFSMIFAHAPIILPAVLKISVKPYHPSLYIWFIVLQLSLVARVAADLLELLYLRHWSGMVNGIALIFFFLNMFFLIRGGKDQKEIYREKAK